MLAEYSGGAWIDYVWLNGRLIGRVAGGQRYAIHDDQTGRPEAVTNGSGAVVWRAQNFAFTQNVTNAGIALNLGFPGQYYDAETSAWNNGFRDYKSTLGRYVESDPIGLNGGVNTYAYAEGNPVSNYDLTGLKLCKIDLPGLPGAKLDDAFAPKVQDFIALNQADGISVSFTEAFRSSAYQASLANNPNAITPAAVGDSWHEAGFAVDIRWRGLTADQRSTVVANANSAGLFWGGV